MSTMYGADVEQLREMARSFEAVAERLRRSSVQVSNSIELVAWLGPVSAKFRWDWDSAFRPNLAGSADLLRSSAEALRRNALEQERASSADAAAPLSLGVEGRPRSGKVGHALDLAELCQQTSGAPGSPVPEGWREVDPAELGIDPSALGISGDDSDGGFDARIFCDADGNYVLVFRGSEGAVGTSPDWQEDLHNAYSYGGNQQEKAMLLASQVQIAVARVDPNASLTFAGHSLGGGLAALAAVSTGLHATTFNAAGITESEIRIAEYLRTGETSSAADLGAIVADLPGFAFLMNRYGPDTYTDLVDAYHTDNDAISLVQESGLAADAIGRQIVVPSGVLDPRKAHDLDAIRYGLESRM